MKKMLITLCILLLIGCGARKRTLQESKLNVEVVTKENFDKSRVSEKTAMVIEDDMSIVLEPVDPTLPIIYKRDTIYNSKVIYQRVVKDSIVNIRDTVYISQNINTQTKKEESKKEVDTERESFNWKGLTWALVVLLLIVALVVFRKRLG